MFTKRQLYGLLPKVGHVELQPLNMSSGSGWACAIDPELIQPYLHVSGLKGFQPSLTEEISTDYAGLLTANRAKEAIGNTHVCSACMTVIQQWCAQWQISSVQCLVNLADFDFSSCKKLLKLLASGHKLSPLQSKELTLVAVPVEMPHANGNSSVHCTQVGSRQAQCRYNL